MTVPAVSKQAMSTTISAAVPLRSTCSSFNNTLLRIARGDEQLTCVPYDSQCYLQVELLCCRSGLCKTACLQSNILNTAVNNAAFELEIRCDTGHFAWHFLGPHNK